jgi:hypothetical protein
MKKRTAIEQARCLVGQSFDIDHPALVKGWRATVCTVVSYNDERDHLSVHLNNGDIDTHVDRKMFWRAYQQGFLLESATTAPFINTPTSRRYMRGIRST